jgi:hypothetical protein
VNDQRGTGRTTRMLIEAAESKENGCNITVIVHGIRMIDVCMRISESLNMGLAPSDFVTVGQASLGKLRGRVQTLSQIWEDHAAEELTTSFVYEGYVDALRWFEETTLPTQ